METSIIAGCKQGRKEPWATRLRVQGMLDYFIGFPKQSACVKNDLTEPTFQGSCPSASYAALKTESAFSYHPIDLRQSRFLQCFGISANPVCSADLIFTNL